MPVLRHPRYSFAGEVMPHRSPRKNKKPRYLTDSGVFILFGVADGARTHDNRNHNPGLYQLSYSHRRKIEL